MQERADVVIVGAGAAGLMAAIWAGRTRPGRSIVVLDGARSLGAKILVAGGGRCNVTHHAVDESAFAGSSPSAIRKVLLRFDVSATVAFFRELGVELKREPTGKLFPTTDRARTVLDALLTAAADAGAEIRYPRRVHTITREDDGFTLRGPEESWGSMRAGAVILATGGMSLPKSGSDGHGYALAGALGHTITERIYPALVPLVTSPRCFVRELSGLAADVTLEVRSSTGKRLKSMSNAMLCTHFGVSGPAALDISRHFTDARMKDRGARLIVNWAPGESPASADAALQRLGPQSPGKWLRERMPERLARALCVQAEVDFSLPAHALTRERRKALAQVITECELPIEGDRGFAHAEVTAGGVPLSEIRLETMASRVCPGLHLCGEICDVDGRIGGFNFQWAWASGYVAGLAAGSG